MQREKPIIFSCEMVIAILEGRKTQTRREVKNEQIEQIEYFAGGVEEDAPIKSEDLGQMIVGNRLKIWCAEYPEEGGEWLDCPYGKVGDRLWLKETWSDDWLNYDDAYGEACVGDVSYKATWDSKKENFDEPKWRSPISMPRWASRITLEITNIRVERLNDISEEDSWDEGVEFELGGDDATGNPFASDEGAFFDYIEQDWLCDRARDSFKSLWKSLKGKDSWYKNPWVWVIEFKVITN